jgi:hypothetical protein
MNTQSQENPGLENRETWGTRTGQATYLPVALWELRPELVK